MLRAAAKASAKLAGWPGAPPGADATAGMDTGSPRASCNNTLGFSSWLLSTFLSLPIPAPRMDASKASLSPFPVVSTRGGAVSAIAGNPGGGGGGGGGAEELLEGSGGFVNEDIGGGGGGGGPS